jgi:hypothetical protein
VPEPEGDARGRSVGLRISAACQVKNGAVDHVIPAAARKNADVAAFRSLLV